MARISFGQVRAQHDILDQVGFLVDFGNIPGVGGNSRHLSIKCISAPLPGAGNEAFQATMHGHTLNFRGRPTYPGTFNPVFLEDSKMLTLDALRVWLEYTRGSESGNSQGYKNQYAVDANYIVYDTTGKAIKAHIIEGLIINEVPDINFDGQSSAAVQVSPTFKYDRIDWNNGNLL